MFLSRSAGHIFQVCSSIAETHRRPVLPFFTVMLPIFAIFAVGYLLARVRGAQAKTMVDMAIYVFTPCLIFTKVATNPMPLIQTGKVLAFSFILTALVYLVTVITAYVQRASRLDRYAMLLGTVSMNAIFYGLPVIEFTLGAQALSYAVVFVMGMNLIQATVLIYLAAAGRMSPVESVKTVFKIPMLYAFIGGIAVGQLGIEVPQPVWMPLELLGEAAIPVALVVLGIQLTKVHIGGAWRDLVSISVIRLVVSPLLALGLAVLMGLTGELRVVLVLEAAMPSAVNAGLLATEFDTKPEFVAGAILVTTLLSALTLSVIIAVMT